MPYDFWGYEAPSTAHENPDDPRLEIGGQGSIELIVPSEMLPDQLFIAVRMKPIQCDHETVLTYKMTPTVSIHKNLYAGNQRPLETLDLLNARDHYYRLNGQYAPLTSSSPFQWEEELLYRLTFPTTAHNIIVEPGHVPLPYGGRLHWNPIYCESLLFQATHEGREVKIDTIPASQYDPSKPPLSLAHMITSRELKLYLTFEEERYLYRSVSYVVKDQNSLFICFIP